MDPARSGEAGSLWSSLRLSDVLSKYAIYRCSAIKLVGVEEAVQYCNDGQSAFMTDQLIEIQSSKQSITIGLYYDITIVTYMDCIGRLSRIAHLSIYSKWTNPSD